MDWNKKYGMSFPSTDQMVWKPLICPRCDGCYLHHKGVRFYDREKEDAITTRVTSIELGGRLGSETVNLLSGNPSDRRDGLVILFWCETCEKTGSDLELCISQHKGQTFIFWR